MEVLSPIIPILSNNSETSPPRGRKQAVTKSPSYLTSTFAGHTMFGATAEMISNGIRSNRTCTIQISNHLSIPLTNPHFYCYDGGLYYPLPPVIQPGTREACVFSKNPSSPHGVIGVLTYQIGESERRLAVMFSVDYNQLQFRNHFGTAVINDLHLNGGDDQHLSHIKEVEDVEEKVALLFEQMYENADFYLRGGRAHSLANDGIPMWATDAVNQIRGTMSDRGKAIIKLNITNV